MAFEIPNVLQSIVFCSNGGTGAYNGTPGTTVARTAAGKYTVTVAGWKPNSIVLIASNVGATPVQAFYTPTATGFTVETYDVAGVAADAAWSAVVFNPA